MKMPNPEDFTKVAEPKHYSVADHVAACSAIPKGGYVEAILNSQYGTGMLFGMDPGVKDSSAVILYKDGSVIDIKTCKMDIETHDLALTPVQTEHKTISYKAQGSTWAELSEGDWSEYTADAASLKEEQFKNLFFGEFKAYPFEGFKPVMAERHKRTDINIMPFTDDELATVKAFKQAVFDRVVYGLTEQGAPGYDQITYAGGGIRYHGYNGSRCALGFFIDKRDYRSELESMQGSDHRLLSAMRIPVRLHNKVDQYMASVRHSLHDSLAKRYNFPQVFANAVEIFRKMHDLAPADTERLREYDEARRVEKKASPLHSIRRRSYILDETFV